ncbi:unnamed protein product, partial [Rotaria sordida]
PEDPVSYRTRYGSSLLDSVTLVQQARNAGVVEDITPPGRSSSLYTTTHEHPVYWDRSNDIITRDYSSTLRSSCEEHQQYI